VKRTIKYIHALNQAFISLKEKFPGTPINVFYAGSGPFAPFAIPFMINYKESEIKFTITDIYSESINSVKKITDILKLNDSINEFIQCDLALYKHNNNYPLHILITEAMRMALSREPQAMITINMAPQLIGSGIVIPESVKINAVLSRIDKELKYLSNEINEEEINKTRINLGTVLELSKDQKYDFSIDKKQIKGPVKSIDINTDNKLLVLLTDVRLFDSIELKEKESGITYPYFCQELGNIEAGDKINFSFNLDKLPKMICEKVNAEKDVYKALDNL
jgi:hypothetical protein